MPQENFKNEPTLSEVMMKLEAAKQQFQRTGNFDNEGDKINEIVLKLSDRQITTIQALERLAAIETSRIER
jgi:hypothetical protein